MIYNMSREQYRVLRLAVAKSAATAKCDVINYVNTTFGLKDKVTEIRFMGGR